MVSLATPHHSNLWLMHQPSLVQAPLELIRSYWEASSAWSVSRQQGRGWQRCSYRECLWTLVGSYMLTRGGVRTRGIVVCKRVPYLNHVFKANRCQRGDWQLPGVRAKRAVGVLCLFGVSLNVAGVLCHADRRAVSSDKRSSRVGILFMSHCADDAFFLTSHERLNGPNNATPAVFFEHRRCPQ